MQMKFIKKLPIPMEIKEQFPVSEKVKQIRETRLKEMEDIFTGKDDRLLLIIGPCSADNEESVMDYTYRLADMQDKVKDRIMIVPRIYTNKPRTTIKEWSISRILRKNRICWKELFPFVSFIHVQ